MHVCYASHKLPAIPKEESSATAKNIQVLPSAIVIVLANSDNSAYEVLWWFVTSQLFEYTIFILIMMNTITLSMKFYRQPQPYTEWLDFLNLLFTAVFALEFVFKLAAFRFQNYFGDAWNVFDFIIVLGSFIDIVYSEVTTSSGTKGASTIISINFFRLFRVMRLIKLLARGEGIRTLLWTFINPHLNILPFHSRQ
ncbi:muscle calcium channel subunit alpha-1-like [Anopheles moucheti]|uniref:muscle calcium channel subunit alpha-1-like n=1 Tax=Anopheles moucheti TaxID=186751 RepID=UPI0022F06349|nr:muscle calcium channel subunit alpha-1-like [Anopheles moucheti]